MKDYDIFTYLINQSEYNSFASKYVVKIKLIRHCFTYTNTVFFYMSSSSKGSATSECQALVQLTPLHSPHAWKHRSPCFWQLQVVRMQFVLQCHLMTLRRGHGAGGRSVSFKISLTSNTFQPQPVGFRPARPRYCCTCT